jgi:copper(I)-binding protein
MRIAALALAAALLSAPALAGDTVKAGSIEIEHAWARPSATATGAIYLEIDNKGSAPDRLVAASTSAAGKAELHTHIMDGNIARMRPVDAIEVTPGSATVLRPGGLHIMLIGLKAPLKEGDKVALTLTFEKAGKVDVTVPVQKNGAGMGSGMGPGGMGHGGMGQGGTDHMGGGHMMH